MTHKKPLYDEEKLQAAHAENRRLREERDAARTERVKRLYAQGDDMTDAEIARAMGVSSSVVARIRTGLGLPRKSRAQTRQLDLSRKAQGYRRAIPKCRTRAKPVTP